MKHSSLSCQEAEDLNSPYFWDRKLNENMDEIIKSPIFNRKNEIVVKYIKKLRGRLLDIGFGYGHIENEIVREKLNIKMYGIDISKYAVQNAKSKYKGTFLQSSTDKIPFKENYFDVVIALDILEHIPKKLILSTLLEINRVLCENGILIISIPVNESTVDCQNNHHLRKYTEKQIKTEVVKCGFEIISVHRLVAFKRAYHIKSLINKLINFRKPNLVIIKCKKVRL